MLFFGIENKVSITRLGHKNSGLPAILCYPLISNWTAKYSIFNFIKEESITGAQTKLLYPSVTMKFWSNIGWIEGIHNVIYFYYTRNMLKLYLNFLQVFYYPSASGVMLIDFIYIIRLKNGLSIIIPFWETTGFRNTLGMHKICVNLYK